MSGDSTNLKQEFTTELESILESDEAYGSNVQILTYALKEDVINGKFKDSWNNRVYEFIIDADGIRYKPAVKLDSFSADEMPVRFDSYSEGYSSLFVDVRSDGKLTGKRTKKPKCGTEAFGCGFSCIGLLKTCRIPPSGGKTGSAIGKERLNKLIAKAGKLYAEGNKKGAVAASAVANKITEERNKKASQLREERRQRIGQQQVKTATKPQEKKPAKPKSEPTKPTSDPTTNPKTHSIKTQKEFEDVFLHVVDKLSKDPKNTDSDVPIYQVREAIGELVPRDKFNQYIKDLQGNDDVLLHTGSPKSLSSEMARQVENSITTKVNGLRFYIALEDQAKSKIKSLDKEKRNNIEKQLTGRPDLDPLGSARQYTKGAKITSQKEFEDTAEKVVKALNDEFNYDDLVPITKVREALGERVSPETFDRMMIDLSSKDKYQLIGYGANSNEDVPEELAKGAVISKINGARHYIKNLIK